MNTYFDWAFNYLLKDESTKYIDDPRDSGGPTKFGITLLSYSAYTKRKVEASELKNLPIEKAKEFYLDQYWTPLCCGHMSSQALATAIFDSAVLYGAKTVALMAQKTLVLCGMGVIQDGIVGADTLSAINRVSEMEFLEVFNRLLLRRINMIIFYSSKNGVFRNGWVNRANRLLTLGSKGLSNKEVT